MNDHWLLIPMLICIAAFLGFKIKALSVSGAIATIIIGSLVALGLQFKGLLLLGAFFISSSFWSQFNKLKKEKINDKNAKGDQRDFLQVLANGFVPAFFSLLFIVNEEQIWFVAFASAIAAANADTWASEIGPLSKKEPFHIFSWKRVEAGTSGAISLLGTTASFLGASFIAIMTVVLWPDISISIMSMIVVFGFLGSIIDTLIGATIQVTYRCQICAFITEKRTHCNKETEYYSGIKIINNEVVNAASIFIAALLAVMIGFFNN